MLEAKSVTYTKEKRDILFDINLKLPRQKIIGILGPNGSGKSTLMQLFSGLRYLKSGEIELDGHNNREYRIEQTVYMAHDLYFNSKWAGKDVLKHYQKHCSRFNFQRFMGMVKQLNVDLKMPLRSMSRGAKERLLLSFTLSQNAEYYFLDEPLTGIDMVTREEIIRSVLTYAEEDATIIISSHYLDVFEMLFDEVYFINEGKIIEHIECEQMRSEYQMTLSEYYLHLYKGGVSK